MMHALSKKPVAVFLDREGVITPKLPKGVYVTHRHQAMLAPDVLEALRLLVQAEIPLFIVSNQSCVAAGLISLREMWRLHQLILDQLSGGGVRIIHTAICPHADADRCACRKPLPGLFLDLGNRYDIDLTRAATIGDSPRDMEAGHAAGIPYRILLGDACPEATACASSLSEACQLLLTC